MSLGSWGAATGGAKEGLLRALDIRRDARAEARQRELDARAADQDAWRRKLDEHRMKLENAQEARTDEQSTYDRSRRVVRERLEALGLSNQEIQNILAKEELSPLAVGARNSARQTSIAKGDEAVATGGHRLALLEALSNGQSLSKGQGRLAGALFGGNATNYSDEAEKEAFGRQMAAAAAPAEAAERLFRSRHEWTQQQPYDPFQFLEGTGAYTKQLDAGYNQAVRQSIDQLKAEMKGIEVVVDPMTGGMRLGEAAASQPDAQALFQEAMARHNARVAAAGTNRDNQGMNFFSSFAFDPRVMGSAVNRALMGAQAPYGGSRVPSLPVPRPQPRVPGLPPIPE